MSSKITWFVFPKDSHTNKVISDFIGSGSSEEESLEILCEDGELRGMWRISSENIRRLWNSKNDLGLKF